MRRREVLRLRAEAEAQQPIARAPMPSPIPQEKRAAAGHCPRCDMFVGRAIRAHALICDGKAQA